MHPKDALGRAGEQAAAEHLERNGLRVLARNWRCSVGEIDIIAVERRMLVVCEVKTRSSTRYGTPLEAVTRRKYRRLRQLAIRWLTANGVLFHDIRIDVIGVTLDDSGGFTIEHVRGVS
jgi:putative endonuclease